MIENSDGLDAGSPRGQTVLADLSANGPVRLEPDERLWKLYIFRPAAGRATRLEHRIYTKLKASGELALVTFAVHHPQADLVVRSGVAHVPALTRADLDRIIETIRRQTGADNDEYEEVDLSHLGTLSQQLEYLTQL